MSKYRTNAPGYGDHEHFHVPDKIGFKIGYKMNQCPDKDMFSGIRTEYPWPSGKELIATCNVDPESSGPTKPPKPPLPPLTFSPPPAPKGIFNTALEVSNLNTASQSYSLAEGDIDKEVLDALNSYKDIVQKAMREAEVNHKAKIASEYPKAIRMWEKEMKAYRRAVKDFELGNYRSKHMAPVNECSCGFYCSKSLENCVDYNAFSNTGVIAEVAMWGKIITGTKGYRSQIIYPQKLWVLCDNGEADSKKVLEKKDALAKTWKLEVRVMEEWMFNKIKRREFKKIEDVLNEKDA